MRLNSKPIYVAATLLLGLLAAFLVHRHAQLRLRLLNDAIQARANEISKLQDDYDRLTDLFRKEAVLPVFDLELNEVLKLRGEIGVLRQTLQDLTLANNRPDLSRSEMLACKSQLFSNQVHRLTGLVEQMFGEPVPEFQYLSHDAWLQLLKRESATADDHTLALASVRSGAQIFFAMESLSDALHSFAVRNNGRFPGAISDLQGYFKSPVDDAVLKNWVVVPTSSLPGSIHVDEDWVITQKEAANPQMEQRIVIGLNELRLGQSGSEDWGISR